MAVRTFKLKDASSTGYGTLTEATATAGTMGSGWTVATNATGSTSTLLYGTTRAGNTFTTAGVNQLATQANFATGQAWRTDIPIHGTFASATNWTMAFSLIAVSTAASQTVRISARVWKSSDPVGATANQTQLTVATAAGFLTGTTAAFTKATAGTSTITWTPGANLTFNNEYLFISTECQVVAPGSRAGSDAIHLATSTSVITTPEFTAATTAATAAESISLVDAQSVRWTGRVTNAESLVLVDTVTGKRFTRATASETLSLTDAQSKTVKTTPLFVAETFSPADTISAATTSPPAIIGAISETLVLSDNRTTRYSKTRSIVNESIIPRDKGDFVPASAGSICVLYINPPDGGLAIGALAELPCVPAPAAGNIAESIVLVDTQVAKKTTRSTASETLSLTDTVAGSRTTRSTAAETLSLTDAQTGLRTTKATASESLSLTDSLTGSRTSRSTASESISLVDTATALRTTRSTASETLSLTDTQTGQRTTRSTVSESISLTDTSTASRTARATSAETLSLVDAQSAKQTSRVSIAETITPVDAQSARYRTLATVAETLALLDTQDATAIHVGVNLVQESLVLVDTQTARQRTQLFLTETLSLVDSQSARQTSIAAITETIAPSDTVDASIISGIFGGIGEIINPVDLLDAIIVHGAVDKHDGGFVKKKKKKKKTEAFAEEIDRRERLRKQITEVIHPPIPPEEPEAAPVEVEPDKPIKPLELPPVVDYAGLARDEIVAKLRQEAELKARQAEAELELKRLEDIQEEEELEMILEALL